MSARPVAADGSELKADVFVHLAHGFDARHWEMAWRDGRLVGFNAHTPYSYHLAEAHGLRIRFSQDRGESRLGRLVRLGLRAILGFDLLHAWHNRRAALAADVIWTHTESQFLAFALILRLSRRRASPRLLGQTVWIVDRWARFSILHRALYRWLVRRVDVLTLHSPLNLARARAMFPETRCELVLYGISTDLRMPAREPRPTPPLKVVALGNDEHRDWDTLLVALGNRTDCTLQIVTGSLSPSRATPYSNVAIGRIGDNAQLHAAYREADLIVVPLKANLHASGISVMQEAALSCVPMIASDAGGLRAYFSDAEVCYVPPGDPAALAAAFGRLAAEPETRRRLAARAAERMGGASGLGAEAYIRRHVDLSAELLSDATIAGSGGGPLGAMATR